MNLLICYLILMNAACLLLMHLDKKNAKKHRLRIPEATLFLFCILGGSLGGTLGLFLLRHKTKKLRFVLGFPAICITHLLLAIYYYL